MCLDPNSKGEVFAGSLVEKAMGWKVDWAFVGALLLLSHAPSSQGHWSSTFSSLKCEVPLNSGEPRGLYVERYGPREKSEHRWSSGLELLIKDLGNRESDRGKQSSSLWKKTMPPKVDQKDRHRSMVRNQRAKTGAMFYK